MEQVTVINTRKSLRRFYWYADDKVQCLKLGPGANLVDANLVEQIQKNPKVKALFDRNVLFSKPVPKATKEYAKGVYIEDLRTLKPDQALQAIKDCTDPAVLQQWLMQDGRKRVQDALFERHEEIMADKEPEEAKEAE